MAEQATTLDEKALRKPGFVEGARIKLADGQEWSLPRPRYRLVPFRTDDGRIEVRGDLRYPPHRQPDHVAMTEATKGEGDIIAWLEARTRLAAGLLLDNYDIDNAALEALLPIEAGDPANEAMWREIHDVLTGRVAPLKSAVEG